MGERSDERDACAECAEIHPAFLQKLHAEARGLSMTAPTRNRPNNTDVRRAGEGARQDAGGRGQQVGRRMVTDGVTAKADAALHVDVQYKVGPQEISENKKANRQANLVKW